MKLKMSSRELNHIRSRKLSIKLKNHMTERRPIVIGDFYSIEEYMYKLISQFERKKSTIVHSIDCFRFFLRHILVHLARIAGTRAFFPFHIVYFDR